MERKNMLYALCVFLCLILFALFSTSQGVMLTPLVEHYGLVESQQGVPSAALNIGCAAALITSLFVMGRMSKPRMMLIAFAATVILILPLSLKPSFAVLTALYLMVGVAVGYIDTLASSAVEDLFHGKMAARMMGALHAMFGIGGIISPVVMGALMKGSLPWNQVYLVVAGVGLVFAAYVFPVGRGWIRDAVDGKTESLRLNGGMLKRFFGSREQVLILLAVLMYAYYLGGVTVWSERYITTELHHEQLGAITLSLFWMGMTACRLIAPFVKISPVRYIQTTAIAGAVILLPGILSGNAYLMCGAAVISALLAGAAIPMMIHVSCERFSENTMLASTAILLCVYAGQALGPAVIGQMEGAFTIGAGLLMTVAALGLSGACALGIHAKK
ncbi:MAG: MFS transporter [Clostridia bacterium]|nr:MFS transporter [Clostridia bacterium]